MKVTVIGAGNMGGALARGWAKAAAAEKVRVAEDVKTGRYHEESLQLTVADCAQQALDALAAAFPSVRTSADNARAVRGADVVVVAVKPWLVEAVVAGIRDSIDFGRQVVCSIAAGVTTDRLRTFFLDDESARLFYCIPNIAAEFRQSMNFVAAGRGASAEDVATVEALFRLTGDTKVCEERLVGPGMMMASCGIAYVMRFLRAQMEAGVEMGFYPKDALQIALQTMDGATALLRATGQHPEAAIDKVTTPGGTTVKGLNELDHAGFNSAVIRCLKAGLK